MACQSYCHQASKALKQPRSMWLMWSLRPQSEVGFDSLRPERCENEITTAGVLCQPDEAFWTDRSSAGLPRRLRGLETAGGCLKEQDLGPALPRLGVEPKYQHCEAFFALASSQYQLYQARSRPLLISISLTSRRNSASLAYPRMSRRCQPRYGLC
jgi:hypothetical protein